MKLRVDILFPWMVGLDDFGLSPDIYVHSLEYHIVKERLRDIDRCLDPYRDKFLK